MFGNNTPVYEFRGPLGIPIQIAGSIIVLVLFYVWMAGSDILWALGIVAILLSSILLHELGHGWASEIQGVPVRRIVIHGGGGFCERKRSASAYEQEFIVAMGPIVNLVIWGSGLAFVRLDVGGYLCRSCFRRKPAGSVRQPVGKSSGMAVDDRLYQPVSGAVQPDPRATA